MLTPEMVATKKTAGANTSRRMREQLKLFAAVRSVFIIFMAFSRGEGCASKHSTRVGRSLNSCCRLFPALFRIEHFRDMEEEVSTSPHCAAVNAWLFPELFCIERFCNSEAEVIASPRC